MLLLFKIVDKRFLQFFCLGVITVYEFFRRKFVTDIDFWSAVFIRGLILNLNL